VTEVPYRKIHVVINPASGRDEPILNVLNDVFEQHGVDWAISVTKKYGDATAQAEAAIAEGADLVAGYGGDGTQHEIANAVLSAVASTGRQVPMGILPGGTGNGFAREMGTPRTLREATELLCTSTRTHAIDVGEIASLGQATVGDHYFVQRLYVGIEPEQQTSRAMKDKYGVLAYAVSEGERLTTTHEHRYRATADEETLAFEATKVYVVNSGMMGTGLRITSTYSIVDGLLDVFFLDKDRLDTMTAAATRFLDLSTSSSSRYYRQVRSITLDPDQDQPVWADGEYMGRTPVTIQVRPGVLPIVVP
jgi:diacylglycerol kinase (ATP)